jgi:hypothetical protein
MFSMLNASLPGRRWSLNTSPEDPIRSDLQRVDAHVIQPEEYAEIPEITDDHLARAVIQGPRMLDQPQ